MTARNILMAAAGGSTTANYIEDVFSTYLYTGNGSTQTITNGIDLAGKGGLVWAKSRSAGAQHVLADTVRGTGQILQTSTTNGNTATALNITSFNANGYGISSYSGSNGSGITYASWTFRKQPKFFDVVTYTGDGTSGLRYINHSLGSTPGFLVVKKTSATGNWFCYHRSLPSTNYAINLNLTDAATDNGLQVWAVSDTQFAVNSGLGLNANGATYVAYLFAHNAGGFGLTGTDNVISCGSYTGTGAAGNAVTLGYEAQWVLIKGATNTFNWYDMDVMRGMSQTDTAYLAPNTSDAESTFGSPAIFPTATGFQIDSPGAGLNQSGATYIYIAIRRGPMKVPTDGAKVFNVMSQTPSGTTTVTNSFASDMVLACQRSGTAGWGFNLADKLRGSSIAQGSTNFQTSSTAAEGARTAGYGWNLTNTNVVENWMASGLGASSPVVYDIFQRAPGFFDEVCYTGTGSATTQSHNLATVPELMIVKSRSGSNNWCVYSAAIGNTYDLTLNSTAGAQTSIPSTWNNTTPTSSVFSVGTSSKTNGSGTTYVAYLFASCPGVSKVGGYTGTGTTQTINCGFTTGARFVMIKRTNASGDWYVWDTARGIISGNDPYLLVNDISAEVTSTDYIDPVSTGFEISSTAPAAINASGGTYIFLAIA